MERRFAIIGAGAVGSHLALALKKSGQQITQIISRGVKSGQVLANELDAVFAERPEELEEDISHILLTLPDQAILDVIFRLPRRDSILIHTSGSFPMEQLEIFGPKFGVLYPLQSFTKYLKPKWEEIPFFVEASSGDIESDLMKLVEEIGTKSVLLDSEKRIKLHMAAVFASNFTNYLQGKAQKLMSEIGLSDELIKPLVVETIRKSFELGAKDAQTGPARRGDDDTIKKHLDLLSCCEMERNLYQTLSESIWEEFKK